MNGLRSLPTGSHLAMDNQLVFFGKENTRDKILDVVVVYLRPSFCVFSYD